MTSFDELVVPSTEHARGVSVSLAAQIVGSPVDLPFPVAFVDEVAEAGPESASGADGSARPPRRVRRRDRKDKGRIARRSREIHAYDGPNGSGKSYAMVFDTLPTLDGQLWECRVEDHRHTLEGVYSGERRVLANLALFDPETGLPHPLADRLVDWKQLLRAEHCDILLDEVMGVAAARDNAGLPGEIAELLQKLRHFDITLRFTSPRFMSAHIDLRSPTKAVTSCRGFFPNRSTRGVAWAPNRMFNWRTFSTEDYEDNAPSRTERDRNRKGARAKIVAWVWGPGSRAFAAYDTLGVVGILRKTLPSGVCSTCGGRRAIPKCSCDD